MADTTKRKRDPQFTTPIGTFRFPRLNEPDFGNAKFPTPQGVYSVQLLLPQNDPETKKLIAALTPHHQEALALGAEAFKALPVAARKKHGDVTEGDLFTLDYDKETEEPTGDIIFKFKLNASGVFKAGPKKGQEWSATPVIFDSRGARMMNPPAIWSGTRGRVSFSAGPYFVASDAKAGLSTRLLGVQIIELVSKGERTAADLGFGAVDGGYEGEGMTPQTSTTRTTSEEVDDEIIF